MLAKLPETRPARWDLVRQVAARYRVPGRDFKAELGRMGEHLARLAVPIPAALREWYEVAAELTDLWSCQDRLLGPSKLYIRKDGLVFAAENQYCWESGVLLGELGEEDPPVVWLPFGGDGEVASPSVSVFAVQMLLSETFCGGRHAHFEFEWRVGGGQLAYLLGQFRRCDLPDIYLWAGTTSFYERDGVLLRLTYESEDQAAWGIATQDAQTFDEVMNELMGAGFTFELYEEESPARIYDPETNTRS